MSYLRRHLGKGSGSHSGRSRWFASRPTLDSVAVILHCADTDHAVGTLVNHDHNNLHRVSERRDTGDACCQQISVLHLAGASLSRKDLLYKSGTRAETLVISSQSEINFRG